MDFQQPIRNMSHSERELQLKNGVALIKIHWGEWHPLSRSLTTPDLTGENITEKKLLEFLRNSMLIYHGERWPEHIQRLCGSDLRKVDTLQTLGVIDTTSGAYVKFSDTIYADDNNNYYNGGFDLIARGSCVRVAINFLEIFQKRVCLINHGLILVINEQLIEVEERKTISFGNRSAFLLFQDKGESYLQNEHTKIELKSKDLYRVEQSIVGAQMVCGNYTSIYKINDVWFGQMWGSVFYEPIYPRMLG
jgi:hypothetical protein